MLHYSEMIDYLKENIEFEKVTNNKKITYYNIEVGFDIETTSITTNGDKYAFMYIWQIGIGYQNRIFYGRTWIEFLELCTALQDYLGLDENNRLIIYIHNLGYEFQFMRKYFEWVNVFSVRERKPIKALTNMGIEFRDSWILSGSSLEVTAKNLGKHTIKKLKGDLDYSLVRHHETSLTFDEINYCINDVQIILAYINEQIELSGDITKVPLTNTGRVRKYVRDMCYKGKEKKGRARRFTNYTKIMQDLTLDTTTYLQLKKTFMGGFTHANANYVQKVVKNVTSIDFTSSYPSVMISEKFPMSRFKPVSCKGLTIERFENLVTKYALIFTLKLINVTPKISQENYISSSKCISLVNPLIDNGRVVSADELTIMVTEIDYTIIKQVYNWTDIELGNLKYAHKAYLPKPIVQSVLDLYQDKTQLKGVEGMEVEYLLSKGMLNSIYGMSVTDIIKPDIIYNDELETWQIEPPDFDKEIDDYNKSRNRFLYYAWGIWVTAYARRNLWTGIIAIGDDYIYSDTDSLKLINYDQHKSYIDDFNKTIVCKMENVCNYHNIPTDLLAPKSKDGKPKLMGVWDYEGTYNRFKTLGAKRYLVEDNGELHITVAGLQKKAGVNYLLEQSNNDIEKAFNIFDDNLYIPKDKTDKLTHNYIDHEQTVTVTDYQGKTTTIHTLSALHLEDCEFTLSLSEMQRIYLKRLSQGYIYTGVTQA